MENSVIDSSGSINNSRNLGRLKIAGLAASIAGIGIFVYFVYSVGLSTVIEGVSGIGVGGFALILGIYLLKLFTRAVAWSMTVYGPYKIRIKDTFPAVVIGEALSTVLPMGILISGTAKAIAVRKKVPLVVGLSSVATENLFYSLVTGSFICAGTLLFLRQYDIPPAFGVLVDAVLAVIVAAMIIGAVMVLRQWHWVSGICNWIYDRGFLTRVLRNGRLHVRMFENLIYGFYRAHPGRFLPLCGLQIMFHAFGILEVWFILTRIANNIPAASTAFFLESMSRLVTFVFKLVPFLIGIDEASAEFVVESLGIAVGIGVTFAIVRKGRVIFWALIGFLLILKRGLTLREVQEIREAGIETG